MGSTWRRAHATCCLHLRMLHVLRVLHEWLVAPVMVLALMHCHQVCWRWAIHRVQDRARKWQTLHKDGVRTTVWPSWGHHHGLPRQLVPMLVPVLRWGGRAPVLLLWQRWAHPWHLVRVEGPPGPGVCLHHHVSGLQAGCLRHRHTTVHRPIPISHVVSSCCATILGSPRNQRSKMQLHNTIIHAPSSCSPLALLPTNSFF